MAFTPCAVATNNIASLDDLPNDVGGLTAAQFKAMFDKYGTDFLAYFNATHIAEADAHLDDIASYGEYNISANQSIASGVSTRVVFNTTAKAKAAQFELLGDGTIKVLKAGTYLIDSYISFAVNNTGVRREFLYVNTAQQKAMALNSIQNLSTLISVLDEVELTANSIIEIQAYQNSGSALDVISGARLKIKYLG